MKRNYLHIALLLGTLSCAAGLLPSCHRDSQGKLSLLQTVTGKPGNILVVSPIAIKDSPVGDSLRAVFGAEYPFIPQSEPLFGLTFLPEKGFDKVFQPFRNIIIVQPDADSMRCEMRILHDRWATPQTVLFITGQSYEAIAKYVHAEAYPLVQIFTQAERDRLLTNYATHADVELGQKVRDRFHTTLNIPKGYRMRREAKDFVWLSIETPHISQGILCYKVANRGNWQNVDTLIAHRDGFTKLYVPGPNEGTYAQVSMVIPPEATGLRFQDRGLVRLLGFWDVVGHPMGGSFVSYSHLFAGGDSVVTTGGYIYAPKYPKREYMRELEAILLSQVLPPPSKRESLPSPESTSESNTENQ